MDAKHIRHTRADLPDLAWCGADTSMLWVFRDLDHAAYNAVTGGFTLACPACVEAACKALRQTEAVDNLPKQPGRRVRKWCWRTPDGAVGLTTAPTLEAARERVRSAILDVDALPEGTQVWEIDPDETQHF